MVADLLLVDSADGVVLSLHWDGDVDDVLDDFLDDLLDGVWLVNVGDVFDWDSDDLNLGNGNVIGGGEGSLNDLVDGVWDGPVHDLLDGVRNSDFDGDGDIDGLRNGNVLSDDLLNDLLNGVWDGTVDDSLNGNGNGDRDSDFNRPWDVDNLFDDLFDGVGDLAFNDSLHGVWDRLVNNLLDWVGDLNALTDFIGDLNGVGHIDSLLNWVGDGIGLGDLVRACYGNSGLDRHNLAHRVLRGTDCGDSLGEVCGRRWGWNDVGSNDGGLRNDCWGLNVGSTVLPVGTIGGTSNDGGGGYCTEGRTELG